MLSAVYLCLDDHMFETKTQKLAEILTEVLLLTTSALIQQLMLAVGEAEKQD